MTITNAACTSFKKELLQSVYANAPAVVVSTTVINNNNTITVSPDTSGLIVGTHTSDAQLASIFTVNGGTGVGPIILKFLSSTQFIVDQTPTGSLTANISWTTRAQAMILIKPAPSGNYDATTTNYSQITSHSDEVTGTGYTTGGLNIPRSSTPIQISGTTVTYTFNNPTWVNASFSTSGAMIISNKSFLGSMLEGVTGRSVAVMDFGGTQTVTTGTFTVLLADVPNLLQIA